MFLENYLTDIRFTFSPLLDFQKSLFLFYKSVYNGSTNTSNNDKLSEPYLLRDDIQNDCKIIDKRG